MSAKDLFRLSRPVYYLTLVRGDAADDVVHRVRLEPVSEDDVWRQCDPWVDTYVCLHSGPNMTIINFTLFNEQVLGSASFDDGVLKLKMGGGKGKSRYRLPGYEGYRMDSLCIDDGVDRVILCGLEGEGIADD